MAISAHPGYRSAIVVDRLIMQFAGWKCRRGHPTIRLRPLFFGAETIRGRRW